MDFQSNTDLIEVIKELRKFITLPGNEEASKLIAEGVSGLNGFTDGWALLHEALILTTTNLIPNS